MREHILGKHVHPLGVSTLEGCDNIINWERRSGNTTRLVDNAIQIIFEGYNCVVRDHHEMGENRIANKRLFDIIIKRIHSEHSWLFRENLIKIDQQNLCIKRVNEPIKDDQLYFGYK
jgi:hypothetical protein